MPLTVARSIAPARAKQTGAYTITMQAGAVCLEHKLTLAIDRQLRLDRRHTLNAIDGSMILLI